ARTAQPPALGQHNYLAQLPPCHIVVRTELQATWAALVAGDDVVSVSGLYVGVEGAIGGHVPECGGGRSVYSPALGQHHYLGELAAGHVVVGPESVVAVPRDY